MTLRTAVAVILLSFTPVVPSLGQAAVKHTIDIPQQQLGSALTELAKQTHIQVVYTTDLVEGHSARALSGSMTPEEALNQLLYRTGLRYEFLDPQTVTLSRAATERKAGSATPPGVPATPNSTDAPVTDAAKGGEKPSFWDRFRLAQVDQGAPVVADSGAADRATQSTTAVEEIVVTAQKRKERLQDVPIPVATINAERLVHSSQLRIQDYYASVPGLNVTPGIQSNNVLSIRGVTTGGGTNPTVGVTVDDVPFGASTNLGGGNVVPDIDPGDLAQLEVLRGPQGTLYGAGSMGGLLKFVTVDPSTEAVRGTLQLGSDRISSGDGLGYNVRGFVNVPLGDALALRASAFHRRDPGYIDNIQTGEQGVNAAVADGGRLSMLWQATDSFSVKLSALLQRIKGDGPSDVFVQPGVGDLEQKYFTFQGPWGYQRKVQAYSATLAANSGDVSLTSLSGYNINAYSDAFDATWAFGTLPVSFFGVTGTPFTDDNKTKKFTQELRLSMPFGQRVEWLLGAFYTHEHSEYVQRYLAGNTTTGAIVGIGQDTSFPTTYEEYAGFTNLTVRFTDQFDVQFGARESSIRQTYAQTVTGPYVPVFNRGKVSPFIIPEVSSDASAFTYLVTPRLKLSPDVMVYARLASGYRAGGPNPNPGGVVPPRYDPDKTQNYELGFKGAFFDQRFTIDASLYRIIWKDIQLSLLNPATFSSYKANGSRARSKGAELTLEVMPARGLTIGTWVAWTDAVLIEPFQPGTSAAGVPGDRLPFSARFSGNLSLNQEFSLTDTVRAFFGGALVYVGNRIGVFQRTPVRQEYPAYARLDLRTGLRFNSWTADLFVNNLTDRRGALTGGLGAFPPFAFTYIQPRTVGLQLGYSF